MNNYQLNCLGKDWVWSADTEDIATMLYIKNIMGREVENLNFEDAVIAYKNYCVELDIDSQISWTKYIVSEEKVCKI